MAKKELEPVRDHAEAVVTQIRRMKGQRKLDLVMQGKTHVLSIRLKKLSDCAPCPKKECDCSVPACDRPKVGVFFSTKKLKSLRTANAPMN